MLIMETIGPGEVLGFLKCSGKNRRRHGLVYFLNRSLTNRINDRYQGMR